MNRRAGYSLSHQQVAAPKGNLHKEIIFIVRRRGQRKKDFNMSKLSLTDAKVDRMISSRSPHWVLATLKTRKIRILGQSHCFALL